MTGTAIACVLLFAAAAGDPGEFVLASPTACASIVVPDGEPPCVGLAAADLTGDVERIAGRKLPIVSAMPQGPGGCVVLATLGVPSSAELVDKLDPNVGPALGDKWEAYRVRIVRSEGGDAPPVLLVAGSDERGTMFGLYALIEEYLGVDPMHFWADRPPNPRPRLAWKEIGLSSDGPSFRYRGWFINDEDLLTEWYLDGGKRDIRYPFYDRVTSPKAAARVFEAMLRLRMNLVIPASFVDVRNPDEERLIAEAARRGLFVSQHHIEPLGVSGFGYQNYWRDRGEKVPYSFIRHPEKFEEIWRDYARRWAKYGDRVVWQLGLRGIADQPVWAADPHAPKTGAERGKMISDAMRLQWEIVRSVDEREAPPMTTTLWMEGAALHRDGHLEFPPGVTVVFSDNSPGWELQRDFYEVKRREDRYYGLYYHQALWGTGPHLVQGVSPWKIHGIFKQAVDRRTDDYAIMNVSNVREFTLGVDAASRMLWDFDAFDPDAHLAAWCKERFGPAAAEAERCYRRLFDSFVEDAESNKRRWMDGEVLHLGERVTRLLQERLAAGEALVRGGAKTTGGLSRFSRSENGTVPFQSRRVIPRPLVRDPDGVREKLSRIERQLAAVRLAGEESDRVLAQLGGANRQFFETNFVAQQQILVGLLEWVQGTLQAALSLSEGDRAAAIARLEAALGAMDRIRRAQALATRGRFEHWYRGDKKMNLGRARQMTEDLLGGLRKG
jgi:hypothetical protein